MKKSLTWLLRQPVFWISAIEAIVLLALMNYGFRFVYAPYMENNWEAIGATGQWASAIVGLLIPIAAVFLSVYLTNKINESKKDIGASNIAAIEEIENIKRDIEGIRNNIFSRLSIDVEIKKPEPTQEEIRDKNKEKVHKFVSISMFAHTADVAEHLGISKEEAFGILKELVQYDRKISAGGQLTEANMDNVIWLKK